MIRNNLKNNQIIIWSALLSMVLFILIYGIRILNPWYTDWLMTGGDLTQHELGWQLFCSSKWYVQGGLMNTAAYPFQTSVIFTDSIPLCALLFKFLKLFLPGRIQYFGLWGLLCFALQGGLTAGILKKLQNNDMLVIFGSLLAVLMPAFLNRMYLHTALAAHWLILLAILYMIEERDFLTECIRWGVLGILCGLVHLYFLAMCGLVYLGFFGIRILDKKWKEAIVPFVCYAIGTVGTVWYLGGFHSGMDSGAPGIGYYNFNLNGLCNPETEWSVFLSPLPYSEGGQYEGFSYLGAGILVLLFISLVVIICNGKIRKAVLQRKTAVVFIVVLLTVFVSSLGEIAWGEHVFLKYELTGILEKLCSPFRSSGRFIWPVCYILLFGGIWVLGKFNAGKWKIVAEGILGLCLLLQLCDLSPRLLKLHKQFFEPALYENRLEQDTVLEAIEEAVPIRHIVYLDKDRMSQKRMYEFTDWALKKGATVNDFYFARNLKQPVKKLAADFAKHPDTETLFVLPLEESLAVTEYPLHWYMADIKDEDGKAFLYGIKSSVENLTEVPGAELRYVSFLPEQGWIVDGKRWDDCCVLQPSGFSYGPFIKLAEGEYFLRISGKGLMETKIETYADGGASSIAYFEKERDNNLIEIQMNVPFEVEDFEVKLTNHDFDEMTISKIQLYR